jgi:hypothetical protein
LFTSYKASNYSKIIKECKNVFVKKKIIAMRIIDSEIVKLK